MPKCFYCDNRTEDLIRGMCKTCRKEVKCTACGRGTENKYSGRCLVCSMAEDAANEQTFNAMAAAKARLKGSA